MAKKLICLLFAVCIGSLTLALFDFNLKSVFAEQEEISITAHAYEFEKDNDYQFSSAEEVSSMTYGRKTLGTFSISADLKEVNDFRGVEAYGVLGNVSFSYSYDGSLQTDSVKDWNLVEDTGKKVDGFEVSSKIRKGVMLVQKSYDGITWEEAANSVVNFFEDNKNGAQNFYTTSGEDIAKGTYYRVIFAYKTKRSINEILWGAISIKTEYKKHVEVYQFYLAKGEANISIHNLAVSESDILDQEGTSSEILQKGETLTDGSMTSKGFSIDKLGAEFLVKVFKNGEIVATLKDGEEGQFTENGKYEITTMTKVGGNTTTQTVYVFNGGEDKGFSTYFGKSFIKGDRIYSDEKYPTYDRDTFVQIDAIDENLFPLSGVLTNATTGEVFSWNGRDAQRFPEEGGLSVGEYNSTIICGNENAGSLYRYSFNFIVEDKESSPFFNYNNLMNREVTFELATKHYEVAYQTTGGGYILICFALESYDEAFKYAYEIEKRFIEKAPDGLYYKSPENDNQKVKFDNTPEGIYDLMEQINANAKRNVNVAYFVAGEEFYKIHDGDILENLESLSYSESVRLFPSQEEKEKMFNRMPYINDFEFMQVGSYDVESVVAHCEKTGEDLKIEFSKSISEQLSVTSKYTITETNIYGDVKQYDVYYVAENKTVSKWEIIEDGEKREVEVSMEKAIDGKIEITADRISLKSIENKFDPDTVVTIKGVYTFELQCLISELKDISLYRKGTYTIKFIDRVNNPSLEFIVTLTGKETYSDMLSDGGVCYTTAYNKVYLNANKSYIEEETGKDKSDLNKELKKFENAIEILWAENSFYNYRQAYENGIAIYNKTDALEKEIMSAVAYLQSAYSNLEYDVANEDLLVYLKAASNVNCLLYTPQTVQALADAYALAVAVYNDEGVQLERIIETVTELFEKLQGLVEVADFSSLLTAIEEVQKIDKKSFTTDSVKSLKIAYNRAIAAYKDRNQPQKIVDEITAELLNAKNSLVDCGDESLLSSALQDISQNVPYMIHTKESLDQLTNVYNKAIEMLNERRSQEELDFITQELCNAKDQLVVREDKKELYDTLKVLSEINLKRLRKSEKAELSAVYESALAVLYNLDASEEETLSSLNAVKSTMDGFDLKAWKKLKAQNQSLINLLTQSGFDKFLIVAYILLAKTKALILG